MSIECNEIWCPKWCNCWIWAIYMERTRGGYIAFRVTDYSRLRWLSWYHSFWSPNGIDWYSYVPYHAKSPHIFPPPIFRGWVKEGLD